MGAHFLRRCTADDLAHGAFGDHTDEFFLVAHIEQVFFRILDLPQDGEADIDQVLVAGQHQPFIGGGADGGLVFRFHPDGLQRLDRPDGEMQARGDGA